MVFERVESETGYSLIFYVRSKKAVIVLVDPSRRQALRPTSRGVLSKPNEMTFTITFTFDSPGDRKNPLYVDFKVASILTIDYLNDQLDAFLETTHNAKRAELEEVLEQAFEDAINAVQEDGLQVFKENFGEQVGSIAKVAGYEYKSGAKDEAGQQEYPSYQWIQVWHHYKKDNQELTGQKQIG